MTKSEEWTIYRDAVVAYCKELAGQCDQLARQCEDESTAMAQAVYQAAANLNDAAAIAAKLNGPR